MEDQEKLCQAQDQIPLYIFVSLIYFGLIVMNYGKSPNLLDWSSTCQNILMSDMAQIQ